MQSNSNTENKERIAIWLYPSTISQLDMLVKDEGFKNRSACLDYALSFYLGFLNSKNAEIYLNSTFISTIKSTLGISENNISRLIFKLAVELDMMMNVFASEMDISIEEVNALRDRCIRNVKKTSGNITFQDALKFQKGI